MAMNRDLLSKLPLHLLTFILSLLPFKDVVKTCVLSKKWLNVCRTTPNIEFNELNFVKLDQPEEVIEGQRKNFLDFIKYWIENHKGTLVEKFSLRLSKPEKLGEIINQCVDFATRCGVKELALDFADADRDEDFGYFDDAEAMFALPAQVYEYNRLESLKLYACSFLETEIFNFHALKEVSLGWMEVDLDAINALLLNCNVLDSLCFKKCWSTEKFELGGEHSRLRKLVIDKCCFDFESFIVNAPNLKIFYYCGMMYFSIPKIHSPVLEEVELDFSPEYRFDGGSGDPLCNLMEALSTTRVLSVCNFVLQVIPSGTVQLPDMNVRHLTMKTSLHEDEFMGITFFLNICPMLERLTLELTETIYLEDYEAPFYFNTRQFWIDDVEVYKSMCSSLKVLEVNGFRGTMNEQIVLSYFIFNGYVLEKLIINMFEDASGMVESHVPKYAENLLTTPSASRNLEITIS